LTKRYFTIAALTVTVILLVFSACRKKNITSNDTSFKLLFSNDSIIFDTVFTSIGSATRQLMIYNPTQNKVIISSIVLEKGQSSPFRINIDGQPVYKAKDVELNGGDSLYLFARVTIDPSNVNNPFIVEDNIRFLTNGNEQNVKLVAWGQNAVYIVANRHTAGFPNYRIVADSLETVHWTNEKPYVIYGYAVIDSYGELDISAGVKIYFHKNSGLWAYSDGTLKVNGSLENPVIFQGDRLEADYANLPGQWDRIWLMDGRQGFDDEFHNVLIKNGFIGIQAESFLKTTENKLILDNVVIENMDGVGIFSRYFVIEGKNIVIANCGGYCMALTGGGTYDFKQTTLANYWPYSARNNPALYINNFLFDSLDNQIPFAIDFTLGNSIVYGYNENEFQTEMVPGADSLYLLDHCLIRTTKKIINGPNYKDVIINKDPLFLNTQNNDYRIDSLSPVIGKGDPNIAASVPLDILGNDRTQSPDLGAYQFEPGQHNDGN